MSIINEHLERLIPDEHSNDSIPNGYSVDNRIDFLSVLASELEVIAPFSVIIARTLVFHRLGSGRTLTEILAESYHNSRICLPLFNVPYQVPTTFEIPVGSTRRVVQEDTTKNKIYPRHHKKMYLEHTEELKYKHNKVVYKNQRLHRDTRNILRKFQGCRR